MKTRISFYDRLVMAVIASAVLILSLAACQAPAAPEADASTSIHIRGSGALMPLAQMTAENLMQDQPETIVVVSGGGSGRGILSLINGTCDIALASAPIIPELAALSENRGVQLESVVVAFDAIVPIVHLDNPVRDLTLEQLRGLFDGTWTNWADVNGPDRPVELVSRNTSSGTYEAWKQLVLGPKAILSAQAQLMESQPMKEYIMNHPEAIGYSAFSYLDDSVAPVSVNGVAPSRTAIEQGHYPLRRALFVYFRADAPEHIRSFVTSLRQTASQHAEALSLFAEED
ncbi:MAG: PstS family phosphate ABC transporter substrate-binding protein [Clostridia bacterium]|nr:PstS family phosphate ABC transporter substrate-binding protein [Clostridia bacterium]